MTADDNITIETPEGGERELVRGRVYFVKTVWEDRDRYPHGVARIVVREGETVLWVRDPDDASAPESFTRKDDILDVTPARRTYVPDRESVGEGVRAPVSEGIVRALKRAREGRES